MSFKIFSRTKNAFLGYKKKKLKKWKNWHFSKGVNLWFWSKNGDFSNFFFLGHIGPESVFFDILDKKGLSRLKKTRSSNSRKIDIFLKGLTHAFGPKMAIFPNFFFRHYKPGKCLLWYSRTKKRFSRL